MNWTQKIERCEFCLDYVFITIVSDNQRQLVKQLSQYAHLKRKPKLQKFVDHPIMPMKFGYLTYFSFGKIVKMYLIHQRSAALQGINAILVLHDVPILELAQIEKILEAMPAVTDFHFCRVEFKWDLYPKVALSAVDLQKHIVRHLHLKSAQDADQKGKEPRITYYIGVQPCDLQAKVYIRPKRPNPPEPEFVRFELTAKTDWLQPKKEKGAKRKPRLWLSKPSDFKKFTYRHLTRQVKWLDIDWAKLRTHQYNLLTGGIWRKRFDEYRDSYGIAASIIRYRKKEVCSPRCSKCGHRKDCSLLKAHGDLKTNYEVVKAVKKCPLAVPPDFEDKYTCESKFSSRIERILEKAYDTWNFFPPFVQIPQKLKTATMIKKVKKRKIIKAPKNMPLKYQKIFKS
jgi:hypothetical protein